MCIPYDRVQLFYTCSTLTLSRFYFFLHLSFPKYLNVRSLFNIFLYLYLFLSLLPLLWGILSYHKSLLNLLCHIRLSAFWPCSSDLPHPEQWLLGHLQSLGCTRGHRVLELLSLHTSFSIDGGFFQGKFWRALVTSNIIWCFKLICASASYFIW